MSTRPREYEDYSMESNLFGKELFEMMKGLRERQGEENWPGLRYDKPGTDEHSKEMQEREEREDAKVIDIRGKAMRERRAEWNREKKDTEEVIKSEQGGERGRMTGSEVEGAKLRFRRRVSRSRRSVSPREKVDCESLKNFMDHDPSDSPNGGTGGKSPKDSKDEPPKPSLKERFLAANRFYVLPPREGKLRRHIGDGPRVAKMREIRQMTAREKRDRKLLQLKRRMNQYGMLATTVTFIYLMCFAVAWKEHHVWKNENPEKPPPQGSLFAMWCACMVWICCAGCLNMVAIRTIYKLWVFGRETENLWSNTERRWHMFSKSGLGICILIGVATIVAFGLTVKMLMDARLLEIERGYRSRSNEGTYGLGG
ncbi:hypothetical protein TWF730_010239 [Orbilia blumenaviensis]|uniref:Uncharacterized protein n=1 Tax=Orbilia blumenaviensis TaxID=1796055 RepID=A0AAV9UMM4_9PEZI